jgi:DNA-binding transcriptional LysR family regulator
MRNIPTDLLRAFIAIIDLRGFTRAGEQLGRTQPAISLQMKRLQETLGVSLFAKDSGGTKLTEEGEIVAGYARQILNLNDGLMLKLARRDGVGTIRIGIPNDYADYFLPRLMRELDLAASGIYFNVECGLSHELLRGLREDRFDVVVAMTPDGPAEGAFMTWREKLSWVGGRDNAPNLEEPLRIVCYQEGCNYRRSMLSALQRDGRNFSIVYVSPSLAGIEAAVAGGFGITVLSERIIPEKLTSFAPQDSLPRLSDVVVGIYLNDRRKSAPALSFAARFADMFA